MRPVAMVRSSPTLCDVRELLRRPDTAPPEMGFSLSTGSSILRPDSAVSHAARYSKANRIARRDPMRAGASLVYDRSERIIYNKPHVSTRFCKIDIVKELNNPLQDTRPKLSEFDKPTQARTLKTRCSGFGCATKKFRSCYSGSFSGDAETGRLPTSRVFNKDYKDYKALMWDRKHASAQLTEAQLNKRYQHSSNSLAIGAKVEVFDTEAGNTVSCFIRMRVVHSHDIFYILYSQGNGSVE